MGMLSWDGAGLFGYYYRYSILARRHIVFDISSLHAGGVNAHRETLHVNELEVHVRDFASGHSNAAGIFEDLRF
jgi:hypothetical protein